MATTTAGEEVKQVAKAAAIGGTVGAGSVGAAAGVFSMMGFTSAGPAAGSIAASWMSSIAVSNGVGVVAGSTYASIQSFMMGGAVLATCGTAAVVGTVGGLAAYGVYRYAMKKEDARPDADGETTTATEQQQQEEGETEAVEEDGESTQTTNEVTST
eukprot:TRINITY_DN2874_c0_g1_i1.p1 TRINITY_DN2874_c0_g1~~TRINITY_DN2874_c0_g1_i1.p1  ORF type:complete len:157 (+),score=44.25 TRINITY_DN2874_c0_g1_i1:30-500(+)